MRIIQTLLLTLTTLIIMGCGSCEVDCNCPENYKPYLYNLFLTEYFWSDRVNTEVNYDDYNSPQAMIDALKYTPKDQWSFMQTKKENDDFFQQNSVGFGFGHTPDNAGNRVVFAVRLDSPAFYAGLKRGDILIAVNHQSITTKNLKLATVNLDKPTTFTLYRPSIMDYMDIDIQSKEYTFRVTDASTITTKANENVGYLRFDSFTGSATQEIDDAFTYLKAKKIQKLIIDLRYNGGGSVVTTSILLDKLVKNRDEEVQFELAWNEAHAYRNEIYRFETDENSLDLKQIIFLTTSWSASASEILINALKPYLEDDVVIIGDNTHGKPVGMAGKTDGTYIYYLVNFVIKNANGFYDYFNGLEVTQGCQTFDDIQHELGDPQEQMLKTALFYIDNGYCE